MEHIKFTMNTEFKNEIETLFSRLLEIYTDAIDHWSIYKVLNNEAEVLDQHVSDLVHKFSLRTKNAHQNSAISSLYMLIEKNQPNETVCLDLFFKKIQKTNGAIIPFECNLNSFFENNNQPEKKTEKAKLIAYRSDYISHKRYIIPHKKNANDLNLTIEDVDNLFTQIQKIFEFFHEFVYSNDHFLNFDFKMGELSAEAFIGLIKK